MQHSSSGVRRPREFSDLKADETQWTDDTDDILDLRYIDLEVAGKVAADAQPGDYQLSFVVMDENYVTGSGNIKGNEIIKINMPVNVTVPSFADMFEQEAAEWNTAKTEFNARILHTVTEMQISAFSPEYFTALSIRLLIML